MDAQHKLRHSTDAHTVQSSGSFMLKCWVWDAPGKKPSGATPAAQGAMASIKAQCKTNAEHTSGFSLLIKANILSQFLSASKNRYINVGLL